MNQNQHNPRVCLIAYSCSPGLGSEEGVGWGWTVGLSKYINVTVITRKNNIGLIRKELEARKIAPINVVGCDLPIWLRFWKRGARGAMAYHYIWQLAASREAGALVRQGRIDIIHHLNFAVTWQPCWAAYHGNCLLGPLDGLGIIRPAFWPMLGWRNSLKEILRGNIIWCGEHLDPFVGSSLKKCLTIICRTHFVAERLLDRTGLSTDAVIPDTGLDQEDIDRLYRLSCRPGKGKRVQLIFLGRLIARKGVGLAIKSFARVASQFHNAELIVIGDGPERRALEELSDKLGLNSRVRFTGRIDRNQAWELLAEGDVFLYPSLRDAVATVVLEAMAAGLPVVCLEGTGPAQVVTPDIGLVARGNDEKEITDDLAVAISRLLEDKDLRQKMGRCAQETVAAQHSWEARAQAMMKVYASMERRLKEHG